MIRARADAAHRADWIAYSVVGLVSALLLLPTNADPDLWGHLRYGFDILEHRTLTPDVPYAFTADHPFVYHEWLGGLSMALAYDAAGVRGLVLLKVAILAAALATLALLTRDLPLQLHILALLTVLWALLPISLTVRPQLWSILAVILLLALLDSGARVWLVPPLMLSWANLHGGWIVGAGVVAIWSFYHLVFTPRLRVSAIAVLLLSAAASLINPYGVGLWRFIAETVRLERSDIQEWQPLWSAPVPVWGPWLMTAAAVVVVLWRGLPRPRLDRLVTLGLFAYASIVVLRLVPFFVVMGAVFLAPSLSGIRAWHVSVPSVAVARLAGTAVAVLGAIILVAVPHPMRTGCLRVGGDWAPDLRVGAALQAARPSGRLVVPFNWGQYVIWHLGPSLRVSIDGRRETVYTDATIRLQRLVAADSPEGRAWLEASRPEFIWMPASPARKAWLLQRGYRIDVETTDSALAVRADLAPIAPASAPAACFPG